MWCCRQGSKVLVSCRHSSKISVSCRTATVKLELAAIMAAVCLGGSTVPAAVVIVVEYKVCLSVSQLIIGIQVRSFVSLIGHGRLGHI